MQRRISALAFFFGLCLAYGPSWAQVLHPNQIVGTINFTNSDPAILEILATEGFNYGVVQGTSLDTVPPLAAVTELSVPAPAVTVPYELTVEAGPPEPPEDPGIAYNVAVDMRLDHLQDRYLFTPAVSDKVVEEPAQDVTLHFNECAGILDIRWETRDGAPVSVVGGEIAALRETFPGSGSFELQAQAFSLPNPTHRTHLAVRGNGSLYEVSIYFDIGTDPFSDKIRFLHKTAVKVGCDEIVEIIVIVDPGAGGLGRIIGQVDMLGEAENLSSGFTFLVADNGPFGNFRYDTVQATPSQGSFELENLVPSDRTDPPTGYRVFGAMSFRLGRRAEYLNAPVLEGPNLRVFPAAGQTTDLGTTFVMDPGFVAGDILLAGPPVGTEGSCLQDVYRDADSDADGDGVPDDVSLSSGSVVLAHGLAAPAPGSTKTAFGGFARVGFEGTFNPGVASFLGNYELVLGGLLGEPSLWAPRFFDLRLADRATPEVPRTYQDSRYQITDHLIPDRLITPRQRIEQPFHYCFNQVNLTFRTTAGTFFNPQTSGSGRFVGTDFENNPADYSVSFFGTGTPVATPASQGLIVLCVAQGSHTLFPQVTTVNPGGGTSVTQFLPVTFTAGCRQVIDLTVGCQPVTPPSVRTQGFWKRQCETHQQHQPHPSGEAARLPRYVGAVNDAATFAAVANVPALCDRLDPQPADSKCEQAEAQLMALLLNLASERVASCNCLQDPDLGDTVVDTAVTLADRLLSNLARQHADCVRAQAIADRINNSATLVRCPAR